MTILVTGATGLIGGHVAAQLATADQRVRALTRDPDTATLPPGVEAVRGDLTDPVSLAPALEGVEALHLIAFGGDAYAPLRTGPGLLEQAVAAGVRRVTVLTGTDDELAVLRAVEAAGVAWTHVRPVEFMGNARHWADAIRSDGTVRAPFGDQPGAVVHEADVAAVIVAALLQDGHAGRTYTPTGPQALTRVERVRILGRAIGRDLRFAELSEDEERENMRAAGIAEDIADFVLAYERNPPPEAYTVLETVDQVTGRPPRTFTQWAGEHADAFRPPPADAA